MNQGHTDKPPTKVAAILIGIMLLLAALAVVFFYFVAFHGLSNRQMNAAGVLFLLVGIPLLWAASVVAKPYSGRRGG